MFNKRSLLMAVLCITVVALSGTEAGARRGGTFGFINFDPGSIIFTGTANRLGNVEKVLHVVSVRLTNFVVEVDCLNKNLKSKHASRSSQAHFPDVDVNVDIPVTPDIVHNGTADLYYVFTDAMLDLLILPRLEALDLAGELCVNDWWTWNRDVFDYLITGFDARLVLWDELNGDTHIIEATCILNDAGTDFDIIVTYDSQAG